MRESLRPSPLGSLLLSLLLLRAFLLGQLRVGFIPIPLLSPPSAFLLPRLGFLLSGFCIRCICSLMAFRSPCRQLRRGFCEGERGKLWRGRDCGKVRGRGSG